MQVGQKVYLKPSGNNARGNNNKIQEWLIKKVGRKYFEVWNGEWEHSAVKFHIEDCRQVTNYCADWSLYFSKQEILDEEEFSQIETEIRKLFGYGNVNLSLEQLRAIKEIINKG